MDASMDYIKLVGLSGNVIYINPLNITCIGLNTNENTVIHFVGDCDNYLLVKESPETVIGYINAWDKYRRMLNHDT